MRTVALQYLQRDLDDYVRAAGQGETIAVIAHGRVVAEIGPPRDASEISDEALLEQAAREGWLTRAEVDWREPLPDQGPAPPDDPDVPFDALMAELAQAREDR